MTRLVASLLLTVGLATSAAAGFSGPVIPDMWFPKDDAPVTRTTGGAGN